MPRKDIEIIILNESQELRRVYQRFFEIAGLKIGASLSNLADVLAYLQSNMGKLRNSVLLLDWKMRDMSYGNLVERLRPFIPNQRIILASSIEDQKIESFESLFGGIVRKPFTIPELVEAIEKVASPLRIKGSWIYTNQDYIEDLLDDIISDSKIKMCLVRDPTTIRRGIDIPGHTPSFMKARSKGIEVFLITKITKDNMFYCKQMMLNRGIHVRHMDGVINNFAVWDEKHLLDTVLIASDSSPLGHQMYSNLDSVVAKSQFQFDHLWSQATPAEQKIKELEANSEEEHLLVLSGIERIIKFRIKLNSESRVFVDACVIPDWLPIHLKPELLQSRVEAVSRGVHVRMLTDITTSTLDVCKKLMESGAEIRHLSNLKGGFAVNEKEVMINGITDPRTNEPLSTIYSINLDLVEEHRSIFTKLWNVAVPGSQRMKEIINRQEESTQLPPRRGMPRGRSTFPK